MTTQRIGLCALITLLALMIGCNQPPKTEAPATKTDTTGEPATHGQSDDIQQPGEPNPTGTPAGESVADQPVDTPLATLEVPDGTPMDSDQEQALALLNFMETQADAPRWVLTWRAGAGKIDLDNVTGMMQRTNPGKAEDKFTGIDMNRIRQVAKGASGWGG